MIIMYGQSGLFECMHCHKVATEDPGVFCPTCTAIFTRKLEAIALMEQAGMQEKDIDRVIELLETSLIERMRVKQEESK